MNPLNDALREIAREDDGLQSPQVRARLMAEFRARRRSDRPDRRAFALGLALASVLAAVVAVPVWRVLIQGELPSPSSAPAARRSTTASTPTERPAAMEQTAVTTAFLPLAYSAVPASDARIVTIEVPREALATFGLAPVEALDAVGAAGRPAKVLADVVVGEDGLARAVRFVRARARPQAAE